MSQQRFLALMAAALLAIGGAFYLSTQRNLPRDTHGTALLPALASQLDSVTEVEIRRGAPAPAVTLHKQSDQWTVAQRGDYPADLAKLRKLLLAMSEAKIVEEKTSNPASFPIIGVEDASKSGATGVEVDLNAKGSKLGVIVGKAVGQGNFARRVGEMTSYSVEPGFSVESEARAWLDTRLLDLPVDQIKSVEVKLDAGQAYAIRRMPDAKSTDLAKKAVPVEKAAPAASAAPAVPVAPVAPAAPAAPAGFALDAVPAGRKAADSQVIAPSSTTFGGLTLEDVVTAKDLDFSKSSTATITMMDGSVVTLTGAAIGEKRWIQVTAPKDAALTAKATGRAFELAGYRYDSVFRPLEQLLVPKPAPEAKKVKAPASPGP